MRSYILRLAAAIASSGVSATSTTTTGLKVSSLAIAASRGTSVRIVGNQLSLTYLTVYSADSPVIRYTKLGFGGAQTDSNQRLMYTWA